MRKTAIIFISIIVLVCLISCSGEGVVDEVFTVTVTYDGNGSTSGEMAPQKVGRGIDARLEANVYERTNYNFTGWNTASDGSGTAYTDCQSINTKGDLILYAQWELDLTDAIILTSDSDVWTDGNTYTLNSDVTIDVRAGVTGDVTLIIPDGYTLTVSRGIHVSEGNSLTINGEGSGTLNIPDGAGGSGIGGDYNQNCGNITINCGTFNILAGAGDGAGIGGGPGGNGGNITINGGTINVIANNAGAGIGGGGNGNGGNVTINGGTINVSGSPGAAGIGRGSGGTDDGTITLGDNVKLTVSDDNSTWADYDGTNPRRYIKTAIILLELSENWIDGNIYTLNRDVAIDFVIVTGNVTLILTDGNTLTVTDGINVSEGNSLTINGEGSGKLISNGPTSGAGIGGSDHENCGNITINGGTINTTGNNGGAGIGGGKNGNCGNITINGGTVIAAGDSGGAGIGGGRDGNGGIIIINSGTVNATGKNGGAGIGGGDNGNCETITINSGTVSAIGESQGGAGIGGGYSGNGGNITINGGTINATGNSSADGIGRGQGGTDAGTLTLGDGVALKVSNDNSTWSDYDGTHRRQYMKAVMILSGSSTSWTDGNTYTLNSDVTIDWFVSVTGNVTLILPDGYTLTAHNGIVVTEGNSLTIYGEGSGTLISTGGGGCAGIGGVYDENCGNITINGGTVNAIGMVGGAGIGGGINGSGGNITINGGTVTAGGSSFDAAGIGKGEGGTDDGTITLGEGVKLQVSDDESPWSDYDGTNRKQYMKTKN